MLASYGMTGPSGFANAPGVGGSRWVGLAVIALAVCGLGGFLILRPRFSGTGAGQIALGAASSPRATTTLIYPAGHGTPSASGTPLPLWMLLAETYTPTPLYVNTPRAPLSIDQYRAAMTFYEAADWGNFIGSMRELARMEPEAADLPYYIGEGYRFQGSHIEALRAYDQALQLDPDFGPAYLGLARARRMQDPRADVEALFAAALERDPDLGEAYLARADFYYDRGDFQAALEDLQAAELRMPASSEVQLAYARLYLAIDEPIEALQRAREAYGLDLTRLETYLVRGQAAAAAGEDSEAADALGTYLVYAPEDAGAFALIGEVYVRQGEFELAVKALDKAIPQLNPGRVRNWAHLQRGLALLELGEADAAVRDLEEAYETQANSFILNISLARAYYLQGKYGTAFLKMQQTETLAETDGELGQVYYWRALCQEERGELTAALADWKALLDLPLEAASLQVRAEAQRRSLELQASTPATTRATSTLLVVPSATRTPTPTRTKTGSPTLESQ